MPISPSSTWHVVVPVKAAAIGKSRLGAPTGISHDRLARALAQDTIAAVLALPSVTCVVVTCVVVTSDPELAGWAADQGARVLPDPGKGLNAAALAGLATVPPGMPGAVLLADLPALTGSELAAGMAECAQAGVGFVPDATGVGTVLLAGSDAGRLFPRFGSGSARAHARVARPTGLDLHRLRRDVDTADDLDAALALGVGPYTRAALDRGTAIASEASSARASCTPGQDHSAHRTGDGVEGPHRR